MLTVEECLSSTHTAVLASQELRAACLQSIEQTRQQVEKTKELIAVTRSRLRVTATAS